jgi:hypothetical protein
MDANCWRGRWNGWLALPGFFGPTCKDSRAKRWSGAQAERHDYEVVCFQDRIERILRGESFRSLDPEKRAAEIPYAVINPFTSLEVFEQERERSLARIRQLSPDQLERRALHRGKGEMTLARLLTEWVDHDLSHVRQLVTTAAQTLQPVTELESRAPGPMGTSGRAVMIL